MASSFIAKKRSMLAWVFALLLAVPAFADFIFLVDGRVLVGTIVGPVPGGVAYTVAGSQVVLPVDQILKTEKSIAQLAELPLSVILKDGSTIRGTIVDYDDDIGLFADIGFGVLTVPIAAIAEIVDPVMRKRYAGAATQFRLGGGVYLPPVSDHFGPSWTSAAGAVFSLPFMRGLSAGMTISFSDADYLASKDVRYSFLSFGPTIEYRFLAWRMRDDFLSAITPLVSLQAGGSFISLDDPGAYPSHQGSMTGFLEIAAGFDYGLASGYAIRFDLFGGMILQSEAPFLMSGARLYACYEL